MFGVAISFLLFELGVAIQNKTKSLIANPLLICAAMVVVVLKVFDINLRQHFYCKETVVNSLNKCNVLKINDEELVVVSEMFAYEKNLSQEDACRRILDEYKLRMLILTCGTEGSYVFTADETSFLPTPEVEVADTVGAGDSFTGSFIASVLKGRTIAEAHKTAVEVAAYVCTRNGAMPLIPAAILP